MAYTHTEVLGFGKKRFCHEVTEVLTLLVHESALLWLVCNRTTLIYIVSVWLENTPIIAIF